MFTAARAEKKGDVTMIKITLKVIIGLPKSVKKLLKKLASIITD